MTPAEHPFAQFVRILGKGKRGARSLTREEAREALGMILDGRVEDTQLGAFLMLLRHKEESSEELAGFTEAVRERLQVPSLRVDLDWPSYAGKKRHLPWYLLAAKCLAGHGVRILMHGGGAHTAGRLYSEQLLAALEIPLCHDWLQVEQALERGHSRGTPGSHCVALPMSSFPSLPRHGFSRSRSTNASSCGRSSCPIASQEDRLAMNPPTGCEALRLASIPARDLRNLKCYGWLRGSDSSITSNQKVKKFHTSPPDRSCLS